MKRILCTAMVFAIMAWTASSAQAANVKLNLATGGTTGIYYTLGGVIAQKLHEAGVVEITAQSTGASNENLRLAEAGEVALAFSQNDLAYAAANGLFPYKKKYTNVMGVTGFHPELIHAVVRPGLGIKDFADIKGHKFSLGARGSGNEINCRQLFPILGLKDDYSDIKPVFLPYGESVDQFKDQQIDGFLFTYPYPHPTMMDITTTHEVQFLPIKGKAADEIIAKYPYFIKTSIPANTYKGQTEAVPTLGVRALLVVNKDVPEETVYSFTKGLFENLEAIGAAHSKGKELTLQNALDGMTVPLHPGAARFFREKGIIK